MGDIKFYSPVDFDDTSSGVTVEGDLTANKGVKFTGGSIGQAKTVLHTNNVLYTRGGSGGMFLQNADGSDGILISNDHIKVETGGLERLRINGSGNVGIGTTSPSYKLHVNGTVKGNDVFGNLFSVGNEGKVVSTSTLGLQLQATAGSKPITFFTNVGGNTERMRITSAGNVGIGTTSPSSNSKLEVIGKGDQLGSTGFYINSSFKDDANVGVFICHDDTVNTTGAIAGINQLSFITYGSSWGERMKITGAGNVGIGTTSPDSKLHVEQGLVTLNTTNLDNGTAVGLHLTYPDTSLSGGEGIALAMGMNGRGRSYIANLSASTNKDASDMLFYTENGGVIGERMRITNSGNLGIGTTSPSEKLHVVGYAKASTGFKAGNYGLIYESSNNLNIKNSAYYHTIFYTNNAERMRITNTGSVGVGTTSPAAKLNVEDANGNDTAGNGVFKISAASNAGHQFGFRLDASAKNLHIDTNYGGTDYTAAYITRNNRHFGIGVLPADARLQVKGSGSTSSTTALLVQNSSTTNLLKVLDDGNVGIGTTSPGAKLEVAGHIKLGDGNKLILGAGSDFNIFHDGSNSNITNAVGNITITNNADDKDIIFSTDNGSGNTTAYLTLDGSLTQMWADKDIQFSDNIKAKFGAAADLKIYHNGTTGNNNIENHGGNIYLTQYVDDGSIYFRNDDGSGGVTEYFRLDGGQTQTIFSQNAQFQTNARLKLGSGGDLQIYNSSGISFIENNTGPLYIKNNADDQDIIFQSDNGSGGVENYIQIDGSAGRTLFNKNIRVNDNVQVQVGSSADLLLHHNGTHSYVSNTTGDLNLHTDTGTLYLYNNADDGDISFQSDNGSGGLAEYFRVDGSEVETGFLKTTRHFDNVKALFGDSGDLRIYHDGYNSYITDTGTGFLNISSDAALVLSNAAGEPYFIGTSNGSVKLYYDNSTKLETTSTGVEITGNVSSSTISIDDYLTHNGDTDTYFGFPTANEFKLVAGGSNKFAADANAAYLYYQGNAKLQTTNTGVSITGSVTATSFSGDGSNLTNVAPAAHNHNDIYYTETEIDANFYGKVATDAKFTSTDGTGDEWKFTLGDESNLTGNKWYKVAQVNTGNGGLHIKGSLSNHVETFGSQKVDLLIQGREANQGQNIEITGTVDVLHNETGTSTDKAGIRVIKSAVGTNYDTYTIYIRTTRYSQAKFHLTKFGTAGFYLSKPSVTSEPAPVTGGNVELDTSGLTEGNYIVKDSSVKTILYDNYDSDATFAGKILAGTGATASATINAYTATVSSNLYSALRIVDNTSASTYWDIGAVGGAAPDLKFFVNASTTPKFTLSAGGNAAFAGVVLFNDNQGINFGNSNAKIYGSSADGIKFNGSGSEKMRLTQAGNLGIGTTNPSQKLHINNSTASSASYAKFSNAQTGTTTADGFDVGVNTGDDAIIWQRENSNLLFATSNSEKMRIDSSGDVGIGTTSPGYKLEIAEDTDGTADLLMLRNSDSTYAQTWGFQSDTNKDLVITGSSGVGGFKFVPGSRGATFAGNVAMQTGNSVGKFAVMSTGVHASYDFYNNGTSYFNGSVVIDDTCLFSDDEQLRFGGANDFLIYHNSTANVNHVSSQLDRQLSINANIIQLTNQANNSTYLKLESGTATFAGNILGSATDFKIGANTSDGSDNAQLKIMGGGDAADTRGASIHLAGNEHANAGLLQLRAGDGSTGGIRLYEGGSERMRITAGNVGIGTTNPTRKLQITDGEPIMRFNPTTVAGDYRFHAGDGKFYVTPEATGIPTMTYSSGNVGIGTTSPGAKLEVRSDGSAAGGAEIRLQHANNNTTDVVSTLNFANNAGSVAMIQGGTTGANNTGYISFFTDNAGASSEKMRILGGGNVGIGTTSPSVPLDILGQDGTTDVSSITYNNLFRFRGTDSGGLFFLGKTSDQDQVIQTTNNDADLIFGTRTASVNYDRLHIQGNTGNVGIGTTSPAYKLDVTGNSTSGVVAVRNSANGRDTFRSENAAGTRTLNIGNDGSGHGVVLVRNSSGTTTNYIAGSGNSYFNAGNVGIGTTSPGARLHVKDSIRIDTGGSGPSAAPSPQTQGPTQAQVRTGGNADYYLSEPDEWLLINIGGTDYVLPAYEA